MKVDDRSVPEMEASALPEAWPSVSRLFSAKGCLLLRGAVPAETVAEARAVLDGETPDPERRGQALRACLSPAVKSTVDGFFAPGAWKLTQLEAAPPRPQNDVPWTIHTPHVDNFYTTLQPEPWSLGMFVFLTRVIRHGGAYCLLPGSHLHNRELLLDGTAKFFRDVWGSETGLVEVLANPGDALLVHHLMTHASSENITDPVTRRAVVIRFATDTPSSPGDVLTERSLLERGNATRDLMSDLAWCGAKLLDDVTAGGDLTSAAPVRWGGRIRFVAPSTGGISVVGAAGCSATGISEPATLKSPPVVSVSATIHHSGVVIVATHTEPRPALTFHRSDDLEAWTCLWSLPNVRAGCVMWISPNVPGEIRGWTIYALPDDDASAAYCFVADEPAEGVPCQPQVLKRVATAPEGVAFEDILVAPIKSDYEFGIVFSGRRTDDGQIVLLAARGVGVTDVGVPTAVVHTAVTTPTRLRLVERAPAGWLVTYNRESPAGASVHLGFLEWNGDAPLLRELQDASEVDTALEAVGLA